MDKVIQKIEADDLAGGEIGEMLEGHASVKNYAELKGATPKSWFSPHSRIALLFPTENINFGHWIGMWVDEGSQTVHHFDSYGLNPQAEQTYSKFPLVKQKLLEGFYDTCQSAGYRIVYNPTRFQEMNAATNTCGRHVICRLRLSYLDEGQYTRLMTRQKMSPDDIVTYLTFIALNEDQEDRAQVAKMVPTSAKRAIDE
jgi:hypothetical protein